MKWPCPGSQCPAYTPGRSLADWASSTWDRRGRRPRSRLPPPPARSRAPWQRPESRSKQASNPANFCSNLELSARINHDNVVRGSVGYDRCDQTDTDNFVFIIKRDLDRSVRPSLSVCLLVQHQSDVGRHVPAQLRHHMAAHLLLVVISEENFYICVKDNSGQFVDFTSLKKHKRPHSPTTPVLYKVVETTFSTSSPQNSVCSDKSVLNFLGFS